MAPKIFVDTDVIIDHLTDREPFANYSSLIFELHQQKQHQVYISALSVNNIYYIARRLIGHKRTVTLIDRLIDNIEIVATNKADIKDALQSGFKDLEDAIQYTTALTVKGISAIITRNVKDYRKSKLAVFTPEIYIKTNFSREQ